MNEHTGRGLGRVCTAATILAAICAAFLLSASQDVVAKKFVGTAKDDKIVGTKKADNIKGRGGDDRLKGKKGRDRLSGGPGNDRVNAVDKARDRKIKGGKGTDVCIIDGVDLRKIRSCDELRVKNRGAGGPGKHSLELTSATGLECDQQLPLCPFQLEGKGADSQVGTVNRWRRRHPRERRQRGDRGRRLDGHGILRLYRQGLPASGHRHEVRRSADHL